MFLIRLGKIWTQAKIGFHRKYKWLIKHVTRCSTLLNGLIAQLSRWMRRSTFCHVYKAIIKLERRSVHLAFMPLARRCRTPHYVHLQSMPFCVAETLGFIWKSHTTLQLLNFFCMDFFLVFLQYFRIFTFNWSGFSGSNTTHWSVHLFPADLQWHVYHIVVFHLSTIHSLWELKSHRNVWSRLPRHFIGGKPKNLEA